MGSASSAREWPWKTARPSVSRKSWISVLRVSRFMDGTDFPAITQPRYHTGCRLQALFERAKDTPEQHQLAYVVRVVVCHQQRLAQQRLSVTMRKGCEQVALRI